jgi:RNA-directed DNA polymerase
MMYGGGKSDSSVVPEKQPNKAERSAAEAVEGRELAKGNSRESTASRTQSRSNASSGLERIRQAGERDKKQQFTALLHHIASVERLRSAYLSLKRDAAAGIDGVTWSSYQENLEAKLADLSGRIHRGAYRASPVERRHIEKESGGTRPIGIPTLEDKIVQRAMVEVLNAIYETDFLGFSYGFRPGRNQHQALDALSVGLFRKKVSWVLDADLRGFFDNLDRTWLVKFIEHRIGDRRVVRLIQKWLNAGVLENGERIDSETGTVQGGSISPLLANIYLHYVFDLWIHQWRQRHARGEVVVVRYADDFVVGFQYQDEAERFLTELRERLARFRLELHPNKTRLIEFGRFAAETRRRRGLSKPETFNFLGFTHMCGTTRNGKFMVRRETMRKRRQGKLKSVKIELRRRLHESIPEQGEYLWAVVSGYNQYFGVPGNSRALQAFRFAIGRIWCRTLRRRSQKHRMPWERMKRYLTRWLPPGRICHPYPDQRFDVRTRGRSPVR